MDDFYFDGGIKQTNLYINGRIQMGTSRKLPEFDVNFHGNKVAMMGMGDREEMGRKMWSYFVMWRKREEDSYDQ